MNKQELLKQLVARLTAELATIREAALATHAEATHEENKAEDKYDTRGLEASYLAHGQSKAADEAALALTQFESLTARDFGPGEPASLGAIVVLEGNVTNRYFIGPRAGGTEIEFGGESVMVVTPQSPLGRQLLGAKTGESRQLDLGGKRSQFRVAAVK